TAHRVSSPRASITSIRVAQLPARVASNPSTTATSGKWLVDPGQWFAPEDSQNSPAPAQEEVEEVTVERSAPAAIEQQPLRELDAVPVAPPADITPIEESPGETEVPSE